ncbi:MAG TPA: zinc-binding alcohol dehydrogenase family protein [Acetobacteraceae bacterium]
MARKLIIEARAATFAELAARIEECPPPIPGPDEIAVEIVSAGVNPSDVRAALGAMPHAVFPRTPGRDWAGIVRKGPAELVGQAMFGTGGDLGISRDGTHAGWLVVHRDAAESVPAAMSPLEAGALGVPFVTAYEGLRRAGLPGAGEVVLVAGVNGKVGQAVAQIATMLGAKVFGMARQHAGYRGHASARVRMIDTASEDITAIVRHETDGHGADIVFNTVGSPYFAAANQAMAVRGRQVFIATQDRAVPFNIFAFYRGQHTYVGIDSLALDARASAAILRLLRPGFERRALRPLPVTDASAYPLECWKEAYGAVLDGSPQRIVLRP